MSTKFPSPRGRGWGGGEFGSLHKGRSIPEHRTITAISHGNRMHKPMVRIDAKRFRNRAAVIMLSLLTLSVLPAQRARAAQAAVPNGRVYTLPMDYEPLKIPFPIVHVRINGSEPLPFILDTGCSVAVVVTETTQKDLRLEPASEHITDTVHTNVRYKEVQLTTVKLCAAKSVNDIELSSSSGMRASVLPGKIGQALDQYKVAGLIGLPLLKSFSISRLDFSRQVLILGWYGDLADSVKDAAELPITVQGDNRIHVTLQAGPDGNADMVVDTGSPSTLLSDDMAYLSGFTLTDTSTYANVSGMHQVYSGTVARLGLGKYNETNVECEVPTGEPNLLGADLLSRYLVTFDLRSSKMYLMRGPDYADRARSRGANSISLFQKDGRIIVASVSEGSAAALAGVKKGDELTNVNGITVQAMPVHSVYLLVNGHVGDKMELDLMRGAQMVRAAYTIESAITGKTGGAGVKVTLQRGGKLVFPDSAGSNGAERTTVVDPGKTVTITPGTTVIANPPATR